MNNLVLALKFRPLPPVLAAVFAFGKIMITITRLAATLLLAAAAQNSAWAATPPALALAVPEIFSNDIKEPDFGSFTIDIRDAEADFGLLPEALRPPPSAPLAVAGSPGAGPAPVPEPDTYVLLLLGAGLTLLKSRRPEQSAPWSLQL
ncbi:MAG TPA: PEP-CTERM sorting domain-containing protein [Janthinobacterium sp.]|nr:PEP-CTERM sorting domain-containing protein [Janthinobacterium sp.]